MPEIDDYAQSVLADSPPTCKRLKLAMYYINERLNDPDIEIRTEQAARAVELMEDNFYKLFSWQKFVTYLVHCFNKTDNSVLFDKFLIVMGRGNGKNGFISPLAWYFTTKTHGIEEYNVDIAANSEEQAKTSFDDVYRMLERRPNVARAYYRSKVKLVNKSTNSYIRYNTSNAKTKDGLRPACLIFDELHEYSDYAQIKVFTSGLGKRQHSRTFMITTRGYVMDGVLDNQLQLVDEILTGDVKTLGLCPLIYELDSDEEAQDEALWVKANPSLPWLPELRKTIRGQMADAKHSADLAQELYTKRFNRPKTNKELAIASRERLVAASGPLPDDLQGCSCVAGIDYALLTDMAACGLLFRRGEERYWLGHAWVCRHSADWDRIKAPLEEWASRGLLTIVNEEQIRPEFITGWLYEQMSYYNVVQVSMDTARFGLLREPLADIGFSKENGNLWMVRPLGLVQTVPVIDSWFVGGLLHWGDNPLMRWATNNTMKVRYNAGGNSGNYRYEKIEPKSRKNDPFMALVHAAVKDAELKTYTNAKEVLEQWPANLI